MDRIYKVDRNANRVCKKWADTRSGLDFCNFLISIVLVGYFLFIIINEVNILETYVTV